MRAILIDWLVEVQESFELNHETLYTAVKITDLYLSKKSIKKEDLQLLGATACLIASKVSCECCTDYVAVLALSVILHPCFAGGGGLSSSIDNFSFRG